MHDELCNDPQLVIDRLHRAWNARSLEALAVCFHDDYESDQPLHPDRRFRGVASVRASWGAIFRAVPDLRADLLRCSIDADTAWTEWRWHGRYVEGNAFEAGGVIIFRTAYGRIVSARVYTETLQPASPDFDQVLDEILRREPDLSVTGDASA